MIIKRESWRILTPKHNLNIVVGQESLEKEEIIDIEGCK